MTGIEKKLHEKMKKIEGEYKIRTDWGKINVILEAIPNYAGGKGRPDEILVVKINFTLLGTNVELSSPVLIEVEKSGYYAAKEDIEKFCERSISGDQTSFLEIPMIIIGGNTYKKWESQRKQLIAKFNITQIPERLVE